MTTRARRRGGARLVERESSELLRPFRPPGENDGSAEAVPEEPDPIEQAFERGTREGATRAAAEAEQRVEDERAAVRRELATALTALAGLEERLRAETMSLMTGLALEAASRIVRERIDADDPVAARAVTEATAALPGIDGLTVRVNPEDVESIRGSLAELVDRRRIELSPDESIERGGCIADSRAGSIDARLETAIEAMRRAAHGERS